MTGELFTDDQLREARARSDVIAAGVPLKRKGRDLVGLCPFHNEKTGSFYLFEDGHAHCFGCGFHGDPIGFLMRLRGMSFVQAVREILELPQQRARPAPAVKAVNPGPRSVDRADEIRAILGACEDVSLRNAAGMYLHLRGLPAQQPALRAHPSLYCHEIQKPLPALIAPLTDREDRVTAVQRIWVLDRVEYAGGGRTPKDNRAPLQARKKSLGHLGDGAVRLSEARQTLGLAEGVETAIAARQMYSFPVWAVCGTRYTSVWIPPTVKKLLIFGDAGEAGEAAATKAVEHFCRVGVDCEAYIPPTGDWNDVLLAEASI